MNIHSFTFANSRPIVRRVFFCSRSSRTFLQHNGWLRISTSVYDPFGDGGPLLRSLFPSDKCHLDTRFLQRLYIRLRCPTVCNYFVQSLRWRNQRKTPASELARI